MRSKAIVNLILFATMALTCVPQATGLAVHEWLSVLLLIPLAVHLLSDWDWIVRTTGRAFQRLPGEQRFNLLWNWLLFVNLVIVVFSGLLISVDLLPTLGWEFEADAFWIAIHNGASNLLLSVLGVHLAMHWHWITQAFRVLSGRATATAVASEPRT